MRSTGYYVTGAPSVRVHTRLICHLQPVGRVNDMLRRTGLVMYRGRRELGLWAQELYGADTLLFD